MSDDNEIKPNPAFFDADLYRFLREKIIDGMDFYIGDRNSGSESKCIWCNEWESSTGYHGYKIVHRDDCPAERLIQMCDEALAILS